MIPDVNLGPGCCKAVATPVMVNASESTFAAELKYRSVILQKRPSFTRCKWNFPKLHCAVCAAGYAGVAVLSDTDTLHLCCVSPQLAQRSLRCYIPYTAYNLRLNNICVLLKQVVLSLPDIVQRSSTPSPDAANNRCKGGLTFTPAALTSTLRLHSLQLTS